MLCRSAEDCFARGRESLHSGRSREALALFEAAIEIEKRNGVSPAQPRYLSFYGLCVALEANRLLDGLRLCQQALQREFYNADLHWNVGRLLLKAGRRGEAYRVLIKGLALQPTHPGIAEDLRRMGARRRPALPFLARGNFVNIWLGKLSHQG